MMDSTRRTKYERLRDSLRGFKRVAIAYSGGADSALVLKVALDTLGHEHVVAVTGRSASLATSELDHARHLAESLHASHVVLDTDEFDNPLYTANPNNRCYYCKATLYTYMQRLADERGFTTIINGTNADDLQDFRPGIEAGRERGVRSPLADAGMTKLDVRALSEYLALPTHDKPASPCLSSRLPYGESVTPEKLRMIEAGEAFLRELGLRECRVRYHGLHTQQPGATAQATANATARAMARIEVPLSDIPMIAHQDTARQVDRRFRELGFQYVALDLRGFRSGNLNEPIALGVVRSGT